MFLLSTVSCTTASLWNPGAALGRVALPVVLLWALLFNLVVRRLVSALPPRGYSLTYFADDLAAAMGNASSGLRALVPVLLEVHPPRA